MVLCGVNQPYFIENGRANATRISQLDAYFVRCIGIASDSIICGCADGKLVTLRLNGIVDCSVVQQDSNLDVTQISKVSIT